jgi:hypothetical protein
VHQLGTDALDDLATELHELLNKFRPQVFKLHLFEILKVLFFGERSDHCAAIALFEETFKKSSDSILLLNSIRKAFLWLESFLEVFFGSHGFPFRIHKLKSKVSDDPHERWEVLRVFLWVYILLADALGLEVYVLGQVDDQRKVRKGVLVD